MPTYFARGVSVRLGAMPLDDTTTQKIILRKGDAARRQSEVAEKRLLKSKLLKEDRVPFPGDEAAFQLNWLARAPFMQTRVGSDVYEKEVTTGTHLPQDHDSVTAANHSSLDAASNRPKALALHVNLSDKTYVSGLYNQKTSLKIDVLFNGTLSACWSMPSYDGRSGQKGHHQVFAGTRVDFLAERPWIVLPPGVAADGSAGKNITTISVEQRWQHLCEALQAEVCERGTDEEGRVPPTAEFLHALAAMQMPEHVHSMQKPGGKTFGVIDVVITSGEGRKLTSGVGYLKTPKRMIDESYPFVLGADGATMHLRSDAPSKSESDAEPPNAIMPSSEIINVDAEGDSDTEYGSHAKKRALRSGVQSTRDVSPVLPSMSQHSALAASIPSILSPTDIGSRIPGLIPPNTTDPRLVDSPVRRSADCNNTPCSPEIKPTHPQGTVHTQEADFMSRAGFTPKMMYPDLPLNPLMTHMRPSPYAIQFSDPTLGGVAPSDLMRQIPVDKAGVTSSPLNHFSMAFQTAGYQHSSSFPTQLSGFKSAPSRLRSHAYSSPDRARGGLSNTYCPRPNYNVSGLSLPLYGAPESFEPNMLPQPPSIHGHGEFQPPHMSFPAFDRRLSMPLPPAGLYSVPTKPRRSVSPKKASSPKQLAKEKANIMVRRLVIYGQDRSVLMDRRWEPALRLAAASNSPVKSQTRKNSAPGKDEHNGFVEPEKASDSHRPRKSTGWMGRTPPTSPSEYGKTDAFLAIEKQQRPGACQANIATDPLMSTVKDSILTDEQDQTEKAKLYNDRLSTDSSSRNMHTTKQQLSRRTTSSNNILGVQGPKANPFWFEDPEEILREASARLRQSRSFAKQGHTPDAGPSPKITVPATPKAPEWETAVSSPLSSLHTTPEPETEPISYSRSHQAPIASSPAPIPQADGSPERQILPRSYRGNQTPSPVKRDTTLTTPQLGRDLSTPQSSATKKRKTLHRTLPKEPRSPTRLKTNGNPLLNRDCVIAYAESKDKKNKQGVLRQVQSERLGVFSENDVVFAARFFVEE
jgi:hypothetical protein